MMKTTIQEQDGNVVAILEGSLDTAAAAETEKAMDPLNDIALPEGTMNISREEMAKGSGVSCRIRFVMLFFPSRVGRSSRATATGGAKKPRIV